MLLLFSSLAGEDLDFGMEVHVNSFQQITKEDQHGGESPKIFTPQLTSLELQNVYPIKSNKQTNYLTHKKRTNTQGKENLETPFLKQVQKAAVAQSELTIMDCVSFQISSIQATPQYAEYQMVRTKLIQIFPFNPLGPLPTAHCPPQE